MLKGNDSVFILEWIHRIIFNCYTWNAYLHTLRKFHTSANAYNLNYTSLWGFFGGSVGKEPASNAGDAGSILGLRRSPGEENGNPLQYSCLRNPMDRGGLWSTFHEVTRVGHNLLIKPAPQPAIKTVSTVYWLLVAQQRIKAKTCSLKESINFSSYYSVLRLKCEKQHFLEQLSNIFISQMRKLKDKDQLC